MDKLAGGGSNNNGVNNEYYGVGVGVAVESRSCILKGALEKGGMMGSPYPHLLYNDYKPHLLQPHTPQQSPNIPYSTDELRRKVMDKYFSRSTKPKCLSVRDQDQVREAFADFVINVPVLVDGHRVSRKAWAKSFYETDMINSAKCLFEALFSEEEMQQCTLNGKNQTKELCAVKMLAILRAATWMKDKEQDPYFFNAQIPEHNLHPSKEEQEKIEKKVFTERRSQANRKNNKKRKLGDGTTTESLNGSNGLIMMGGEGDSDSQNTDFDNNNQCDSVDSEGSPPEQCLSPQMSLNPFPPHPPTSPKTFEFGELEELFYRFPDEFVDTLLPDWRVNYIFIDGLLVEKEKWAKAFEEGSDPVKAAWILFLALFSDQEITTCTLNGKNGTVELCPVKKLAIIRGVEWMRRNQGLLDKSTYWDNDDEDCNVFPSKEDKERIETKVFTEKRYQQSRHLNLHNKVPLLIPNSNGIEAHPLSLPHLLTFNQST